MCIVLSTVLDAPQPIKAQNQTSKHKVLLLKLQQKCYEYNSE